MSQEPSGAQITLVSMLILLFVVAVITLSMWGCPRYNVWQKELSGKAVLRKAEWDRQVAVEEANAKKESAKALASAEVERAKGVAEANKIIGESLKENEQYLRYLFIHMMEESENQIIYIPTEAGMPILEAGKRP